MKFNGFYYDIDAKNWSKEIKDFFSECGEIIDEEEDKYIIVRERIGGKNVLVWVNGKPGIDELRKTWNENIWGPFIGKVPEKSPHGYLAIEDGSDFDKFRGEE